MPQISRVRNWQGAAGKFYLYRDCFFQRCLLWAEREQPASTPIGSWSLSNAAVASRNLSWLFETCPPVRAELLSSIGPEDST